MSYLNANEKAAPDAPEKIEDASREDIVNFLRDLASDPNAAPENRKRAEDVLKDLAHRSAAARKACARIAQRNALAIQMGIPQRGGVINEGTRQIFIYPTGGKR